MNQDDYYSSARKDLQTMLPEKLGRVLDVGCGRGHLGADCKNLGASEVVGIEITEENAEAAKQRLDEVLCGNIESMDLPLAPGSFDTILCADVLEHLVDPWTTLRRLRDLLTPTGCVVASIPNIAHYSIILKLLTGTWRYEDAGLLDRTHLRFFAPGELQDFFAGAGLVPEKLGFTINDEDKAIMPGADSEKIIAAVRDIYAAFRPDVDTSPLSGMDTNLFFVWQFMVRAVRTQD